ncbi:Integrase catalytic core [Arabidopsis suecica]|uniref:Integrase catalytic core n=1 Tax=Arabidopsis suecica TaxID=45249 RepID=A0A8T1YQ60_ARASU|nr:Integrase catalytic core [Arabidopsis suecica]
MSKEFLSFCRDNGIKREFTCPHTPQQNGVAERKIRHLSETCRSWLHGKDLPKALWAEGMRCAAYVINRMPLSPNNMKSPYEMVHGKKPTVKHLRIFGSVCYVHVFDSQRTKLEAKAKKCIFVGYDEQRKGWRCMDPETHKYVVSRDFVFDEVYSYYGPPQVLVEKDGASSSKIDESTLQVPCESGSPENNIQGERGSTNQEEEEEQDHGSMVNQRPKRNIVKPARYRDEEFITTYSCFFAAPLDDDEPSSYDEAKGVQEWEAAMKEEMSALKKNETWDLVPKPKDVEPVSCKWVYRIKRKADGSIDRFKARLVARGFSQKYGEDYDETFSPVAKMTTVRSLLSLAASFGWKLWQLDVKNAFLYCELDKSIFMEQPPGFESREHPDHVCKLKKALYGLKQAPRAWYGKVAQFLQFCGYEASNSDPSLFFKKKGGVHVVVLLYVDDMIITGNDDAEIARLQEDMSIRFEMKKLGELNNFLGLEVERVKDGIFVGQQGYARRIVEKFGVHEGKTRTTPMDVNIKLRRDEGSLLPDARPYRALVGSLLYLTITRPDIAFAVGLVSRFMQAPRKPHLEAAKKILNKKQPTVSLSTTEAEYKASTLAAQECIWLRRLFEDLFEPINKPVAIYGDNQSAIKLANNPVFHARTKHIELEHHFIREKVLDGIIEALEVRSEDNVADIFTKSLPKGQFELLRSKLGMVDKIKFKGEY